MDGDRGWSVRNSKLARVHSLIALLFLSAGTTSRSSCSATRVGPL